MRQTDYCPIEQNSGTTEMAIQISGVYKSYGRASRKVEVLRDFCMNIPRGHIYGLLGPSGCGKTTLLQCIVGKRLTDRGSILVFGGSPGSRKSGVPGPRVGYMPQELALYGEFTIKETLQYFGRIFNMSAEKINQRSDFLLQFLDLPSKWRLVVNLSGGQQRRASLAVALLQEPELLILDEPTVGVDPLLRQTIWRHLTKISRTTTTTIIITTHYVEEARQANRVGMMRFGRLLAEDSPSALIETYNQTNLENVFLSLCLKTGEDEYEEDEPEDIVSEDSSSAKPPDTMSQSLPMKEKQVSAVRKDIKISKYFSRSSIDENFDMGHEGVCYEYDLLQWTRLKALLVKNFIRMWRNLGFLVFQFIIPTVQVSLFCLAIGRDPKGMTVAVVNGEVGGAGCGSWSDGCLLGSQDLEFGEDEDDWLDWNTTEPVPPIQQENLNYSCRFLSFLDESVVRPVYYSNFQDAYQSVLRAEHWGLIHVLDNYSQALKQRLAGMRDIALAQMVGFGGSGISNETVYNSTIHVYLDMTNQQVGFTLQMRLAETFKAFGLDVLSACSIPENVTSLPIQFETPVYGSNEPTFTEFMAPGVILSITYFMAVGLTSISFIIERKEGLLDRSWIAGVTSLEVMLAHVVAQFVVMVVQVGFVLIFMLLVFQVPARGPMVWVVTITILQGICGMAFGLLVSALCDNEQDAIQLALGSFYPNLLLSGIIWPLEGMPQYLRYISYVLPQTFACQALRGILSRGWGLDWPPVYRGFLVTIAWILVLLLVSTLVLKIRR